jgi:hypothetical protein
VIVTSVPPALLTVVGVIDVMENGPTPLGGVGLLGGVVVPAGRWASNRSPNRRPHHPCRG